MPNAEKQNFEWQAITCPQCDGFGVRNRPLVGEAECDRCDGAGEVQQKRTIEQSSKVDDFADSIIAAANAAGPTLRLEQNDAIRNAVASSHWRSGKSLDSLGADGQEVATVNNSLTVQAQASDAITLLYTHGLLTSAMRDHARKKLANL